MKHTLFAIALSMTATSALATGPAPTYVEPQVVMADTVANANDNWAGVMLTFIVFALALGS